VFLLAPRVLSPIAGTILNFLLGIG
jgi:hypothetical protein